MLPSFRLIAATFLCGFVVVFAGLRMAVSLNDMHEGLPVMAAYAAPVTTLPIADQEMRRGQSTVPVMYDMRFAVSRATLAPTLVAATHTTLDQPAPPLSLAPPADFIREAPAPITPAAAEAAPAEPERTVAVAAIQPEPPVIEAPAATIPVIVPSVPETLRFEAPVVAAIEPQPTPSPEPAQAPTSVAVPAADATPAASMPETNSLELKSAESKIAAIELRATPEPAPKPETAPVAAVPPASAPDITASIDATSHSSTDTNRDRGNPALAIPQPKPKAAKKAAPKNAKIAVVRKKRIARRAAPAGGAPASSTPFSSPFGSLQK